LRKKFAAGVLIAAFFGCAAAFSGCKKAPELPKILLVSIDTLRADRLGSYGSDADLTPIMDILARRGIRFSNARAPAPWTLPSHASIFSGLYPSDHRAIDDKVKIRPDAPMMAEILKKAGYKTAAFVTHYYVGEEYGFRRGFDDFVVREEAPADQIADLANRWIRKNKDRSFFLFLHFFDPHTPYSPPPSFREEHLPRESFWVRGDTADVLDVVHKEGEPENETRLAALRALYDAEVDFSDKMLGNVLGFMKRLDITDTIVILLSDHGEEFMEHRLMEHGFTLYEEQLQVPLVIFWPERFKKPAVSDVPVSLVDLLPTVCDLVGLPIPEGTAGKSLMPLMAGDPPAEVLEGFRTRPIFAETTRQGPDRVAVIRNERKFIYTPEFRLSGRFFESELFDLASDPGEKTNLLKTDPDSAKSYLRQIFDSGLYTKRRLFSLVFSGTADPTKYLGTVRTNGSFISAFKDNVIYDTDEDRQLISREFGLKKEVRRLQFLALGSEGENGVHFLQEPQDAGLEFDLLINGARDADAVRIGRERARPEEVPFLLESDAAGTRFFPVAPGFGLWCREVLVNKNVVRRFEIGDEIKMSPEMVSRLKSLGYLDEGSVVFKKPGDTEKADAPREKDLLKDRKVAYSCTPLEF